MANVLRPRASRQFALAQQWRAVIVLHDPKTGPFGADDQWRTKMRKVMTLATMAVPMTVAGAPVAAASRREVNRAHSQMERS